jgi:nucleolar GTP-binding protein
MRRQASTLVYLDQVRLHLSCLAFVDPSTLIIIATDLPDVRKSIFTNKLTRADVEVQPYAFTAMSLLVGHKDVKDLR